MLATFCQSFCKEQCFSFCLLIHTYTLKKQNFLVDKQIYSYILLVGAMDTFARGLKLAARIQEDNILSQAVEVRFTLDSVVF